jgi:hypothetical protein
MIVEHLVEWELAGKTEVRKYSEKTHPQYHIVHDKSHMTWPDIEPRLSRWKAGDQPP